MRISHLIVVPRHYLNEKDDGLAHGTLRCHGARTDAGAFGWTQSNGRKDIRTFYIVK
jgi:hypothetical protein